MSHRESGGLPAQALESGAWWNWSRVRLSAQFLDQRARGQLFVGPQRDRLVGTLPVHYHEGVLGARIEGDAASLERPGLRGDFVENLDAGVESLEE